MRILNWNLDHARPGVLLRQMALIDRLACDIEVLTEPGQPDRFESDGRIVVSSPTERYDSESWVLIRGAGLEPVSLDIPYQRMATAAKVRLEGRDLVVYASVLPWTAASSQAPDVFGPFATDVPSAAIYGAWLTAQLRDLSSLRAQYLDADLFWVGDFNVPVFGSFQHHIPAGSEMLKKALSNFELRAYNGHVKHRNEQLFAIDLICGPTRLKRVKAHVDRSSETLLLSDHPPYWVDVAND